MCIRDRSRIAPLDTTEALNTADIIVPGEKLTPAQLQYEHMWHGLNKREHLRSIKARLTASLRMQGRWGENYGEEVADFGVRTIGFPDILGALGDWFERWQLIDLFLSRTNRAQRSAQDKRVDCGWTCTPGIAGSVTSLGSLDIEESELDAMSLPGTIKSIPEELDEEAQSYFGVIPGREEEEVDDERESGDDVGPNEVDENPPPLPGLEGAPIFLKRNGEVAELWWTTQAGASYMRSRLHHM